MLAALQRMSPVCLRVLRCAAPMRALLQRQLTTKVQRLDAQQAELNTAQAARAEAQAAADAARAKAEQLAQSLEAATRQLAVLGSKDGELHKLAAEVAAAASEKAALEAKVRSRLTGLLACCWRACLPACMASVRLSHACV